MTIEKLPKKCKFCEYAIKKGKYVFCEDKNELQSPKYVCQRFRAVESIEVDDAIAEKFCRKWGIELEEDNG